MEENLPLEPSPVDESGSFPPPTLDPADAAAVSNVPAQDASATERVELDGREFDVPTALAQAYRQNLANQERLTSDLQSTRQTLDTMQGTWDRMRQVFAPEQQGPDLATQIYTDPNAAFQQLEDRIVSRMQGMYQQDQTQQRFWSDFYTEHAELRNFDGLVRTTLQGNPSLQALPNTVAGRETLAKEVRATAMAIANQFGGKTTPRLRSVESGAGQSRGAPSETPAQEDEQPQGPLSINQAMKERRANRRAGRRTQTA